MGRTCEEEAEEVYTVPGRFSMQKPGVRGAQSKAGHLFPGFY